MYLVDWFIVQTFGLQNSDYLTKDSHKGTNSGITLIHSHHDNSRFTSNNFYTGCTVITLRCLSEIKRHSYPRIAAIRIDVTPRPAGDTGSHVTYESRINRTWQPFTRKILNPKPSLPTPGFAPPCRTPSGLTSTRVSGYDPANNSTSSGVQLGSSI